MTKRPPTSAPFLLFKLHHFAAGRLMRLAVLAANFAANDAVA
jgi:hypothetical protein